MKPLVASNTPLASGSLRFPFIHEFFNGSTVFVPPSCAGKKQIDIEYNTDFHFETSISDILKNVNDAYHS